MRISGNHWQAAIAYGSEFDLLPAGLQTSTTALAAGVLPWHSPSSYCTPAVNMQQTQLNVRTKLTRYLNAQGNVAEVQHLNSERLSKHLRRLTKTMASCRGHNSCIQTLLDSSKVAVLLLAAYGILASLYRAI
jgi:hypothetical protein